MPMTRASRSALPAPVLPALLGTGLLFGGLDNGQGNGLVCSAAALLLLWQLWHETPSRTIVRALRPIVLVAGIGMLWAAWTSLVPDPAAARALTPDLAVHELIGIAGYLLVFVVAAILGYRRRSLDDDVDWLVVFIAAGLCAGALLRLSDDAPLFAFWDRAHGDRFTGTLNNANVAANVYAVLALLSFGRLLAIRLDREGQQRRHGKVWRLWLNALACPAAVIAIVATGSRTTIVTVAAVAVLLVAVRTARHRGRNRRRRTIALAGTMLLLAMLATPMAAVLNSRFDAMDEGASGRWLLWSHYAQVASASPIRGYGLGSFPTVNVRYPGALDVAQQLWMVNSPHNLALHLLLEAGWPFLLTSLIAAALVGWTLVRAVLFGWLRLDVAGLLAAAAVMLTGAMVDIVLEVPAPTALFLTLVALSFGQATRVRARRT